MSRRVRRAILCRFAARTLWFPRHDHLHAAVRDVEAFATRHAELA